MDITLLPDPMDTPESLFEARGIPRQVVIDHQPAELQVDSLTRGFSSYTDLPARAEFLLGALPFVRIHAAVNLACRVSPSFEVLAEISQGVAMLRKDEKLA